MHPISILKNAMIISLMKVRENDPPSEQDADAPLLPHPSEALDDTIGKLSDVSCEPNEMLVLAR